MDPPEDVRQFEEGDGLPVDGDEILCFFPLISSNPNYLHKGL